MTTKEFSIIVSNIGTVHQCTDEAEARKEYAEWVSDSKEACGMASGEDVALLCDGEPIEETQGFLHSDE